MKKIKDTSLNWVLLIQMRDKGDTIELLDWWWSLAIISIYK